jgi:hypothetical protein
MINNPLFIKTKQELLNWKKQKKYQGEKIPDGLKDQIKTLLKKYPRPKVTQGLDFSASTIATLLNKTPRKYSKKDYSQIKSSNVDTPNIFHQIPTKLIESKTSLLSFEVELPGKFILRLFK